MTEPTQLTDPRQFPWNESYGPLAAAYHYLYRPGYGQVTGAYDVPDGDGYAAQDGSGLDILLGQRKDLLQAKVDMLGQEMLERRLLRQRSIYRMDLDQCSIKDVIFQRGEYLWDRYRLKLEQSILDLEQEKRRAYENYFRDLLFLKRDLRMALLEEMEDAQKAALLIDHSEVVA